MFDPFHGRRPNQTMPNTPSAKAEMKKSLKRRTARDFKLKAESVRFPVCFLSVTTHTHLIHLFTLIN